MGVCLVETSQQLQAAWRPRKMIDTDAVKPVISTQYATLKSAGKKLAKKRTGRKSKPPSMSSFLRGRQSAGIAPKTNRVHKRNFDPVGCDHRHDSINQAVHKDRNLMNRIKNKSALHASFAASLR